VLHKPRMLDTYHVQPESKERTKKINKNIQLSLFKSDPAPRSM
jgi:hypothetical protein